MSSTVPKLSGRLGTARVAVLTIIEEERSAVEAVFGGLRHMIGTPYYVAATEDLPRMKFDFVVRKAADRGNLPAGQAIADLMEDFKPPFVLLVGIAGGFGGRDGLCLGDVVIADAIEYCEFKKFHKGKILYRLMPLAHPSLYLRASFAEPLSSRTERWVDQIQTERPVDGQPKAIVGNIVSGETLMADPGSPLQQKILKRYEKALAVDMESFGVAREVFAQRGGVFYNPQYLVIRGISDLVNPEAGETDNQGTRDEWKRYAAESAAAFSLTLIRDCLDQTRVIFEEPPTQGLEGHPLEVAHEQGGEPL